MTRTPAGPAHGTRCTTHDSLAKRGRHKPVNGIYVLCFCHTHQHLHRLLNTQFRNCDLSLHAKCFLGQLAEKQVVFKSSALTFALKPQQLSGLRDKMRHLTLVALRINVLPYSEFSFPHITPAGACLALIYHLCSCLEVFLWGMNHTNLRRTSDLSTQMCPGGKRIHNLLPTRCNIVSFL